MNIDVTVTHKEESETKHKIDLLVRIQEKHTSILRMILRAVAAIGDPEELKKLKEELASSTDDLEASVKANTPAT